MRNTSPKTRFTCHFMLCAIVFALAACGPSPVEDQVLRAFDEDATYEDIEITYPWNNTLFPPDIIAPTFRWRDRSFETDAWLVDVEFEGKAPRVSTLVNERSWKPSPETWETIRKETLEKPARLTILGVRADQPKEILSSGGITFSTSSDEVGAPIFYREVNLPFPEAVMDPSKIQWRFGSISTPEKPTLVMSKMPVCGNCHSFSIDGGTFGMEMDSGTDKGAYTVVDVEKNIDIGMDDIITWSDYRKEDGDPTFGLLCQVSPDGRHVVGTVKDQAIAIGYRDLMFSQLFFLIKGRLCIFDREAKTFTALPGASDPKYCQTNATWTPDGTHIVYARATSYDIPEITNQRVALVGDENARRFVQNEGRDYKYDLYRIPFNDGNGGEPEPIPGASNNGMSNYFAKCSPDGKWIVFCKAKNYMLLQPDSELWIVPAEGGEARRLECNTPRMNSWHSWSPNSKWLVFTSKMNTCYTQLFLTHIDEEGHASPPVLIEHFLAEDRAANLPEFANTSAQAIQKITESFTDVDSYIRAAQQNLAAKNYEIAERFLRKAIDLDPQSAAAHFYLGRLLLEWEKSDREETYAEAEKHLHKTTELDPDNVSACCCHGKSLVCCDRKKEAVKVFLKALEMDPDNVDALYDLGALLLDMDDLASAEEKLARAYEIKPQEGLVAFTYGKAKALQGASAEAARLWREAVLNDPGAIKPRAALAWLLATTDEATVRNPAEALKLATETVTMSQGRDPYLLNLLAVCTAAAGNYEQALATSRQVLNTAEAMNLTDLAAEVQERMELYRQNKPWRPAQPLQTMYW